MDGVSFELFDGETLGLVGSQGVGTTIGGPFQAHRTDKRPDIYQGEDISQYTPQQMLPLRHEMQMVFQDRMLR